MAQTTRIRNPISARRLDAYRIGLQLLATMRPHLEQMRKHHKELHNQLERSLPSMINNLSEAMRRTGDDRAHLLTVSLGSADEARASIDIALVNGLIQSDQAAQADHLADRFCAMVYKLRQRFA
jgi:four helix bundle protein